MLPDGFTTEVVKSAENENLVSWSALTSDTTIWISFRGTDNLIDAVIDAAGWSYDHADFGLSVHGGMWLALTQQHSHTLDQIHETVADLQKRQPALTQVVLCGHSLGGAYAILAALDRLHKGLNVTSVCAFGAPQVVVPNRNLLIWQRLHAVTTHYVNSWDLFPRMPSCLPWIFNVLPGALPDKISIKLGSLRVGFKAAGGEVVNQLSKFTGVFAKYDVVGTLVFIRRGSRKVVSLESAEDEKHWELLNTQPPKFGGFVLEQHSMKEYASVFAALSHSGV